MRTRQHIITTGAYANYEIVAVVEGDVKPALSTLAKQFNKEFNYPPSLTLKTISGETISNRTHAMSHANIAARKAGLSGNNKAEIFVQWLIQRHGYVIVKHSEAWVD